MQIVIPMAGSGERFKKAGYQTIKPLIEVHGRPFIEYVINLFPGESDFLFICNNRHLQETNLKQVLMSLKPSAKIFGIDSHGKGPVQSVMLVEDEIKDCESTIINYCDFDMHWDYADFKNRMEKLSADGAVLAYTGFHPHLLGKNFYAGLRVDEQGNILEVKEKHSFAKNKMEGWHSNGSYYFKSGALVKKYFAEYLKQPPHENGEYYASMPYNLMIRDGLTIKLHPLQYFCQWGTPEDLAEYNLWIGRLADKYLPADDIEYNIFEYWKKFNKLR